MRLGLFATGLGSALLAAACSVGGAPDGVVADCTQDLALPPAVSTDILFVIDDSGSMREEQEKVAAQLEGFVAALASGPVENDFRVGVVTTAVTQNFVRSCDPTSDDTELSGYPDASGRLQPATLPGDDRDGPTILSYRDDDLVDRFAALVRRGTEGSGQEMGLEAMRLAITGPLGEEQDFLRPGARLLVVIVTDEDDCSDPTGTAVALTATSCGLGSCETDADCTADGAYCLDHRGTRTCQVNQCETTAGRAALEPVDRYVELLQNLDDGTGRGLMRETFLAVIGPADVDSGEPARCSAGSDEAYGVGVRYRQAVDAMGDNGTIASICADDYGDALLRIAELVEAPQVIALDHEPEDGRLLQLRIERADGSEQLCTQGNGFTFEKATKYAPARLELGGDCQLQHGDKIAVRLFCAG